MSIKEMHEHPDKPGVKCYSMRMTTRAWCGAYTKPHMIEIGGKHFGALWLAYSACWYLFDTKTGREVGSIRKEVFEALQANTGVNLVAVTPMEPAPECKP